MERVPTGIKGFDELILGGFPRGSTILYCGSPGTGKTIFALEFIYRGAKQYNEKSLYVTFEQRREELVEQARQFGWDIEGEERRDMIRIMSIAAKDLNYKTSSDIIKCAVDGGFRRVVVDSLSTLTINAPIYEGKDDISVKDIMGEKAYFSAPVLGDQLVKRFVYTFIDDFKRADHLTTLLIGEAPDKGDFISRDSISEFICDGVILVTFESMGGEFSRSLIVRKMRNTKNDDDIHPLEIGGEGMVVHNIE